MRPAVALLAFAAVACSPEQDHAARPVGQAIACSYGAREDWSATCRLERSVVADGIEVVVHRPDGAFRRLIVRGDGRSVTAADGAAQVDQHRVGGMLEVSVGGDRYRLPLGPALGIRGS